MQFFKFDFNIQPHPLNEYKELLTKYLNSVGTAEGIDLSILMSKLPQLLPNCPKMPEINKKGDEILQGVENGNLTSEEAIVELEKLKKSTQVNSIERALLTQVIDHFIDCSRVIKTQGPN
mgnify:CR=1 FL=1